MIYQYIITIISFIIKPQKRKLINLSHKLKNKLGLEIGGPSSFFSLKSYFPVYIFAKQVDGVNFSTETVWEGTIKEGKNYRYSGNKEGYQFITEASDLKIIENNKYEFLLSCHSLEHIANPIKAVKDWCRIVKPGSQVVLVLPDKKHTFDHNRPYTTFEHLLEDYKKGVGEDDSTHFDEIYRLHDISMDTGVNSIEELKERTINNFENRCVHHHVYSLEILEQLVVYCNCRLIYKQEAPPFHLVAIAEKIS